MKHASNFCLFFVLAFISLEVNAQQAVPANFTNFGISFRRFDSSAPVTGDVQNGITFSVQRDDLQANTIFVNNVSIIVPATVPQVTVSIRQPLLTSSPYCSSVIANKNNTQKVITAINPSHVPLFDTFISSYNNSIIGSFTVTPSGSWRFTLIRQNPSYANKFPGYIPLQCSF